MKYLLIFLFSFCFVIANDDEVNTNNESINANNANKTPIDDGQNIDTTGTADDEKLKDDIINFNRLNYVNESSIIKDPFIYTYPKTKEEQDFISKAKQVKLTLHGILDNKAKINGYWVSKNDSVDGWTVTDIKKDQVKLKFMTDTRVLYVNNSSGVKIK